MFFNFRHNAPIKNGHPPFPEYFLIQTISLCNATCTICPYRETVAIQKQGRMEMSLFKRIIDEAFLFQKNVRQIMPYLMNEPLMDKTLVEKIHYIRHKIPDVNIHLVTNGILLDKKLGERLLSSPINSIKISVLGHREKTYQKVMGVAGYQKIIKRIDRFTQMALHQKGYDSVSICFTNTPGFVSESEIEEASDFWKARGVKHEIINHPISRGGNVNILNAPHHESIRGCNSIWRDKMIHILFNGDVVLCCMDWRRKVILGNVSSQSIEKIWNSKKYEAVRKIISGEKKGWPGFICYQCEEAVQKSTEKCPL